MNAIVHFKFPAVLPPAAVGYRRRVRRGAFALVITLLILSLLIVVAVSYLSSMVGERQTADAYTSKARAEQIAQSGVDSAMATLTESFRDFPDSATVWDTQQSTNNDGSLPNAGTSLYLRAVPTTATLPGGASATVADPQPNSGSIVADDPATNNPSNPVCKNFVLPLISGVPGGRAQLVSAKSTIIPTMNVSQSDPTQQNFADLNVRRQAGDTQGYIGSPPLVAGATPSPSATPKPARAPWVNLKGNDGRTVGRYAYWVDDESFRANNSFFGAGTTPPDNPSRPLDNSSPPKPRAPLPSDPTLVGPLTLIGDGKAGGDATTIFNNRKLYPGNFFPDPLAFMHSATTGASAFTTAQSDWLRYLTTNQSGTLNLTRHGTQRLNLNNVVPYTTTVGTTQLQVDQIVQTLKFHLPYFGERFYRLTTDGKTTTLNDSSQVPGSPKAAPFVTGSNTDPSEIYYYKVAANIIDYMDADSQPTIIDPGGTIHPSGKPITGLNGSGSTSNEVWAVGKEVSPYVQEAAIRLRPVVSPNADSTGGHPFDLQVDYYLEFWNMSDRDIYASPQSDATLPNLHGAVVRVTNQNIWETQTDTPITAYGPVQCSDGSYRLSDGGPELDYEIDLTTGVRLNGVNGTSIPGGVVFKAGAVTVITTDPDCASYVIRGPHGQSSPVLTAAPYATNPQTTYYCSNLLEGTRHYTGTIPKAFKGFEPKLRDQNFAYDYETEVTLCNATGYLDSVPFSIDEHGHTSTWYSDTAIDYQDYTYTSCLMGNLYDPNLHFTALPSQLGDPRTNNEQLSIQPYISGGNGDQSHYIYGNNADATLGYFNPSQKPDATPTNAYPWPDYYVLPTPEFYTATAVNPMNAVSAPMVIADGPLTSIGQLGDVFDPARLPGTPGAIALSRGGGRTFKIGQRDDRYNGDPTGNNTSNNTADSIPNSNGWAAWRLADIFSIDDPIESPARININGVQRDGGAALLALLQGFVFQPPTNSTDPLIHGDNHAASASLANSTLNTTGTTNGFSQIVTQMINRLKNPGPASTGAFSTPSGPFFERGELGEIADTNNNAIFGMSDPLGSTYYNSSTALVQNVNIYKTFDHSREELFRRISELICTRGDTFTVYAVGQSINQPTTSAALKVTGTSRLRVTFRLVPKALDPNHLGAYIDFHPGYSVDPNTGAIIPTPPANLITSNRFLKPDHYDAQVLSVATY